MAKHSNRPRHGSPLHLMTAWELFPLSYQLVKKNIWIFGPLYAVPFIFMAHSWLWSPIPGQTHHWWQHGDSINAGLTGSTAPTFLSYNLVGFSLLWLVLITLGGTLVQVITQAAQLEAAEGESPAFDKLWTRIRPLFWRMLGLYIVMAVIIGIGFILIIIPGLIMLRRYFLAPYVMLDKKVGIRESLDESAAMTKNHSRAIWGIIGVMFVFSVISAVPLVGRLAAFFLSMFYSVAPAIRYQELKKLNS